MAQPPAGATRMDGQLAYNGFRIGRMLQQLECLVQRLRDGIASSIQRNRTAGATFDSVLEEHWLQDGNTSNYCTESAASGGRLMFRFFSVCI
jgi:hypothetical protein